VIRLRRRLYVGAAVAALLALAAVGVLYGAGRRLRVALT
jgi:hypothetical protein